MGIFLLKLVDPVENCVLIVQDKNLFFGIRHNGTRIFLVYYTTRQELFYTYPATGQEPFLHPKFLISRSRCFINFVQSLRGVLHANLRPAWDYCVSFRPAWDLKSLLFKSALGVTREKVSGRPENAIFSGRPEIRWNIRVTTYLFSGRPELQPSVHKTNIIYS